jgi:hypothetical protein
MEIFCVLFPLLLKKKKKLQKIPDLELLFLGFFDFLGILPPPPNVSNFDFKVCLGGSFCSQFFFGQFWFVFS